MAKIIRNNTSGSVQLSPHFYLSEFIASDQAERFDINNSPNPVAVINLFRLAKLMEQVRSALGNKVISIGSGFRCVSLNDLVHGNEISDHLHGSACDFNCRGFGTPVQVSNAIVKSGIVFGQLIREGSWVHISLPGDRNMETLVAHFARGLRTTYTKELFDAKETKTLEKK